MEKKLIFKVEFDKQSKRTIKIDTDVDNFTMYFKEPLGELMDWAIRISGYDEKSQDLLGGFDKLYNFKRI